MGEARGQGLTVQEMKIFFLALSCWPLSGGPWCNEKLFTQYMYMQYAQTAEPHHQARWNCQHR